MDFYFSEHFGINEQALDDYGALDICVVFDLPLFIDPFLLYSSEKPELRVLHEQIIEYLRFLRDLAPRDCDRRALETYFCFTEVRETWLGFTGRGNQGSGLGLKLAESMRQSLASILADFGEERITKSSHVEKLALFNKGIGRDRISDLTTNLIKNYLLAYTERFALKHLKPGQRARFEVPRAEFDFARRRWISRQYELPMLRGEYVLLTPMEILTKDETWINRADMVKRLWSVVPSVSNEELRNRLNSFMKTRLRGKLSAKQERAVKFDALAEFTELYDYYIQAREETAREATEQSIRKVHEVRRMHIHQVRAIASDLRSSSSFYDQAGSDFAASLARVLAFKEYVARGGGHRNLTNGGAPMLEPELGLVTTILWATVNGADRTYQCRWDEPDIVFKRGNNSKLSDLLDNHSIALREVPGPSRSIIVIVSYTQREDARAAKLIRERELVREPSIVLIDARGRLSRTSRCV